MGQQIAIRSDLARELVTKLSQRRGKSITATIEEALTAMDASDDAEIAARVARWRAVIEHDQKIVRENGVIFEIEDMYDEDGLPN